MQISHYLIKYALICIHFLYKNLNTGLGHFQNSCWHTVEVKSLPTPRRICKKLIIYQVDHTECMLWFN